MEVEGAEVEVGGGVVWGKGMQFQVEEVEVEGVQFEVKVCSSIINTDIT